MPGVAVRAFIASPHRPSHTHRARRGAIGTPVDFYPVAA